MNTLIPLNQIVEEIYQAMDKTGLLEKMRTATDEELEMIIKDLHRFFGGGFPD